MNVWNCCAAHRPRCSLSLVQVFLKTENLQVTGSFKLRGAYYKMSQLTDEEKDTLKDYYGKEIILGVRPEDVSADGNLQIRVTNNENLGMNTLVHGYVGDNSHIVAKLRGWEE